MNDNQALTAVYFGMVATSSRATEGGYSPERCWEHAKQLADFAMRKINGTSNQTPLRVHGER